MPPTVQPSSLVQHRVIRVGTLSAMMVPLLLSFLRRSSGRLKTAPTVQPNGRSKKGVSMVGGTVSARSVEGEASVSTGGYAASARSVEEAASVSTGGGAVSARSVEGKASASITGSAVRARSVPLPSRETPQRQQRKP